MLPQRSYHCNLPPPSTPVLERPPAYQPTHPPTLPSALQWAFVNFKRLQDAEAAYSALRSQVVPQLSGDTFLKLQYRPV